jgi:uncharacterized repeat protein (TIGR01451 family)
VTVSAPASVLLGSNFTYVVTITNRGPSSAPNVFLTNTLPGTVQFQSGSIVPSAGRSLVTTGNPIIANLGTVAVSNAVTVYLTVKPQASGEVVNSAKVIGGYDDPISTNNLSSASTLVYVIPVLAITPVAGNQVQLSWPVTLSDYLLQATGDLANTNGWTNLPSPDVVGEHFIFTETVNPGAKYFRLKR